MVLTWKEQNPLDVAPHPRRTIEYQRASAISRESDCCCCNVAREAGELYILKVVSLGRGGLGKSKSPSIWPLAGKRVGDGVQDVVKSSLCVIDVPSSLIVFAWDSS